jgi:hypothetical protein
VYWQQGRMEDVPLPVIGVVRTGYAEHAATPIQAALTLSCGVDLIWGKSPR